MISKRKHKTDFLFPKSSFLIGFGSVFNLFGNYYTFKTFKSSEEADYKALESDWGVIGQDIDASIKQLKKELKLK